MNKFSQEERKEFVERIIKKDDSGTFQKKNTLIESEIEPTNTTTVKKK
jgi:hypothetical protein